MSLQVTQEEADRLAALKRGIRPTYTDMRRSTVKKLIHLHDIHVKHPEYERKDLRMATGYSDPMISRYWKLFVKREIRTWDEVMRDEKQG